MMAQLATHLKLDVAQMFVYPVAESVRLYLHPQVFVSADIHALRGSSLGRSGDKTSLRDLLNVGGSISVMLQQSTVRYFGSSRKLHFAIKFKFRYKLFTLLLIVHHNCTAEDTKSK